MQTVTTKQDLRTRLDALRTGGASVGLVPTMGFLHSGHLSLVERARSENDVVVVSVFVNPTQFGPGEDFDAYPRDLERDTELLAGAGVDLVFAPSAAEMYPEPPVAFVDVDGSMTRTLCGVSRPSHFRGVATVVTKLFNLVAPRRAYFGQKDAQQVAVVRRMVADLDMPVEVVACPIVREPDGLALSSRNTYLDERARQDALVLSRAIDEAGRRVAEGERDATAIVRDVRERIAAQPGVEPEYVQVVDAGTLADVTTITAPALLAVAARVGGTRLIDNIELRPS